MGSMTRESTLHDAPAAGTPAGDLCQLRDRFATLNEGLEQLDRDNPAALDLAAELQGAAHAPLCGSISALGGHRSEHKWRKALGVHGCCLTIVDLAYLATLRTPATRRAVRAITRRLNAAVDVHAPSGSLTNRVAELATSATALLGDLAKAQAPESPGGSQIAECEEPGLRALLDVVENAVRDARAILDRRGGVR